MVSLLRQYVFAHVPGGRPLETGAEPLFAWVRLTVHHRFPGLPLEDHHGFVLRIHRPYVHGTMHIRSNLKVVESDWSYPRVLRPEAEPGEAGKPWRLLEPDGRVRLAALPQAGTDVAFKARGAEQRFDELYSCETRGGVTGAIFGALLGIHLARLAVVDEEIAEGELHLLRLAPAAWFRPGDQAAFERMATVHGPVTLATKISKDGKALDVTWRPAYRTAPRRVVLHVPPGSGLVRVRVNGRPVRFARGRTLL